MTPVWRQFVLGNGPVSQVDLPAKALHTSQEGGVLSGIANHVSENPRNWRSRRRQDDDLGRTFWRLTVQYGFHLSQRGPFEICPPEEVRRGSGMRRDPSAPAICTLSNNLKNCIYY